ncbi:hypothetical protein CCR75_003456 [Bremia lactucae]|uniref:Secreted RxLR effector n=1 Tax=Bremia lactucae TaxID=4779 RepID=A0A976FJY8_BRELC|nr:hypothetical protein CCR75_003456 [Bremia lactucae]
MRLPTALLLAAVALLVDTDPVLSAELINGIPDAFKLAHTRQFNETKRVFKPLPNNHDERTNEDLMLLIRRGAQKLSDLLEHAAFDLKISEGVSAELGNDLAKLPRKRDVLSTSKRLLENWTSWLRTNWPQHSINQLIEKFGEEGLIWMSIEWALRQPEPDIKTNALQLQDTLMKTWFVQPRNVMSVYDKLLFGDKKNNLLLRPLQTLFDYGDKFNKEFKGKTIALKFSFAFYLFHGLSDKDLAKTMVEAGQSSVPKDIYRRLKSILFRMWYNELKEIATNNELNFLWPEYKKTRDKISSNFVNALQEQDQRYASQNPHLPDSTPLLFRLKTICDDMNKNDAEEPLKFYALLKNSFNDFKIINMIKAAAGYDASSTLDLVTKNAQMEDWVKRFSLKKVFEMYKLKDVRTDLLTHPEFIDWMQFRTKYVKKYPESQNEYLHVLVEHFDEPYLMQLLLTDTRSLTSKSNKSIIETVLLDLRKHLAKQLATAEHDVEKVFKMLNLHLSDEAHFFRGFPAWVEYCAIIIRMKIRNPTFAIQPLINVHGNQLLAIFLVKAADFPFYEEAARPLRNGLIRRWINTFKTKEEIDMIFSPKILKETFKLNQAKISVNLFPRLEALKNEYWSLHQFISLVKNYADEPEEVLFKRAVSLAASANKDEQLEQISEFSVLRTRYTEIDAYFLVAIGSAMRDK